MNWKTARVIILTLVAVILLILGYVLRGIFIPVLVALILAYILNPLVTWLESKNVPRLASIGGIFCVFLIVFLLVVFIAIPAGIAQGIEFVKVTFIGSPEEEAKIYPLLRDAAARLKSVTGMETDALLDELKAQIQKNAGNITSIVGRVAGQLGAFVASSVGVIAAMLSFVVLIPVYLFFFLKGMNTGWEQFKEWLPNRYRERLLGTLEKIHKANAAFFRGQVTICAIDGIILWLVLLIAGVKFSLFWGFLYACLAIVPFVGPIAAFAITAVFTFADAGFGAKFYTVLGAFAGIQALEGLVLQPMILGKETGLHPVAIILSLMIFGQLLGFFGVLLAVPLFSIVLILIKDYVLPIYNEVTGDSVTVRRSR